MKKVLVLFLGAVLVLAACKQNASKNANAENTQAPALQLANSVDPICEMKIDNTVEDTVHYKGKVYGFCSSSCKEEFQAEPAKYVHAE